MGDTEHISKIASLITQIRGQQKGTNFMQLIETLKSEYSKTAG